MTRYIFEGKACNLQTWSRITGINYQTLYKRVKRGKWSIADALTKPSKGHKGMRNRTKLTPDQVETIQKHLRRKGARVSDIAAYYYVSPRTIRDIRNRVTWRTQPRKKKP